MRPLLRIKSKDVLLTISEDLQWCDPTANPITFDIRGCILFLLHVKAGTAFYPQFDDVFLSEFGDSYKCGWSDGYGKLPVHYAKKLHQTKPNVPTDQRGATLISLDITKEQARALLKD